jgi:hypothetical protein
MLFEDYHLFEFNADGKRYAIPDPEWDSLRHRTFSAKTTKLGVLSPLKFRTAPPGLSAR